MQKIIVTICLLTLAATACKKNHVVLAPPVLLTPHQWQKIGSPVSGYNSDIYFTSADTGYIFGSAGSGYVLGTVDGGTNWTELTAFSAQFPLFSSFYAVKPNLLFIARDTLYQSTDAGKTWIKTNAWSGTTVNQMYFTDSQTGFILATNKIYTTNNGGGTWSPATTLTGSFTNLVFTDKLHGFVSGGGEIEEEGTINVTSVGSLSATSDGGSQWTQLDTGSWITGTQRFRLITAMDFSDANHGAIVMDNCQLSFTSDGGAHWQIQNKNVPAIMEWMKYDHTGRLFMISGNNVYSSDDNGRTIGLEFSGTDEFLKVGLTPGNQVFLIGRNGQIYRRM